MFPYTELKQQDQQVYDAIRAEERRQLYELELIASENHVSLPVLETMASVFTNKYSEGYIGKRYYAGQENVDTIEGLAIDRAKALFGAEHANVQALSGSPANAAVYFAIAQPGDTILGMSLAHGGHLSHGHPVNFSGKLYNFVQYGVDPETHLIDMDEVRRLAHEHKPKVIVAGFSAYSRDLDWAKFKEIADEVGAITFADIAHIAGLIAGKQLENPTPLFDVVSTTTHKTLRGPRGALILCKEPFAKEIDKAVFPGMQGGPHDHINAAKAVAFKEALQPEFQDYAKQVIVNAQTLAQSLVDMGHVIITGGTDNHLMLLDTIKSKGLSGQEAEHALEQIGVSCNKNMVPFDERSPFDPSGVRLGTPAITTRGFKEAEIKKLAQWIDGALSNADNPTELENIKAQVREVCEQFPVAGTV
ncbi:serine hydroxymethyltransferase [Candidatus Peregrinibacteria bacterium CG11_big_fil_rev_8_21_14_0_20_41_10]|nr:MAG: serine hydroxymethyltransferase [Candidatus Peregrinibacteria bacterium CG11_big_fil_rev_8_21_14_0_20_41_10]PJC37902.1 MAG: serine hydroxymethyltransferase [Candidatus Peregrinibacteria bacterium CG_4_9_14_0_2_um_filter_41_14]